MRRRGRTRHGRARKRRARSSGNSWFWWLVIVLVLLAIGASGYFFMSVRTGSRINEATLCPVEGPEAVLVVVLDLTDPLTARQSERLRRELHRQIESTAKDTMISVGVVSSDASEKNPEFALCRPLRGSEANEIYQNPGFVAERFTEQFQKPLEATITAMLVAEEQPTSPIIESIVATTAATEGTREKDLPKKIILVSDLIQNTDRHSFFRGQTWRDFENSSAFSQISQVFKGFDVVVIRVPEPAEWSIDSAAVDDFWVRYFEANGVRSLTHDRITLGEF